ncbi:MAG: hypothetical protein ABIJ40_06985 [Bacteroidota bacterium]
MKINILFILLFLLVNGKTLLGDSLFVEIINDTVFVNNTQIWENCIFKPKSIVTLDNYEITLIQKDTSNYHAFCNCYYDYITKITGLSKGTYRLSVYRKYSPPKDTSITKYIGFVRFSFNPSDSLSYSVREKKAIVMKYLMLNLKMIIK